MAPVTHHSTAWTTAVTGDSRIRMGLFAGLATGLLVVGSLVTGATTARADAPAPDRQTARYEVDFLTSMIDHHQMAVMMSETCLDKTVHQELITLCGDIITTQKAEIDTMQEWLSHWYGIT